MQAVAEADRLPAPPPSPKPSALTPRLAARRPQTALCATLRLPDRDIGPLPVTLSTAGPDHEIGTIAVPLPGNWTLTVSARTTDIDVYTKSVTLPVR
jgi:copper transport protein